jgi:hypothetical protein
MITLAVLKSAIRHFDMALNPKKKNGDIWWCSRCKPMVMLPGQVRYQDHTLRFHKDNLWVKSADSSNQRPGTPLKRSGEVIPKKKRLTETTSVGYSKPMSKSFDLKTVYNKDRPLSWSAIASFEWNPTQWHRKYVLKELQEMTPELEFGSRIDTRIQNERKFLPKLVRYPILQHEMRTTFDGIPLLGFADTYSPTIPAVRDYKTGRKPWDQKRADETGQLTMYLFMLYLMDKRIKVESMQLYIDWLPTHIEEGKIAFIKEGDIRTFRTKRTMREVLKFGQRIKETYAAMEKFATKEHGSVVHDRKDW